jgi:transcriptional regulator with GAF, ATPase, and Fis domain
MLGFKIITSRKLNNCIQERSSLTSILEEAKGFIEEIEKGNLNIEISEHLQHHEFGSSLLKMQSALKKIAEEEYQRNWITKGLANFSDILRDVSNLEDFCTRVIAEMVKYLDFNQGGIYIANEEEGETVLKLTACYAYNKKKYIEDSILVGEGLVGACFLEKSPIFMTQIPEGYITITSGLGEAVPRNLFLCPLVVNDRVYGVLELASFNILKDYQRSFIEKISENIAAAISNVKIHESTSNLLKAAQEQAEIMSSQEEELRQNLEEMAATQEELNRRNIEFLKKEQELNEILAELNANEQDMQKTQENYRKLMKEHLLLKKEFEAITKPISNL